MRRRLRTALGIGLAGSLLLTGCVPGLDRSSWPTPLPSAEQPGSTPVSPTASSAHTAATGSSSPTIGASPSGSVTVGAYDVRPLPEYAGPRPLPASDGKPMLWPVSVPVSMYSGYQQTVQRSGFLDVTGKLVLPQRYESYQYCADVAGRPVLMIANRGGDARAEVFDLTGKRLAKLPTERADCAGPSYVITTNDGLDEASTQADVENGLYELATGKWLIPPIKGRQLASLRPGLLNVTEPTGEYFLNLKNGRKTAHPGWLTYRASLTAGARTVPASTERDSGKIGFLDLSGHWTIRPSLVGAEEFVGDLAAVELREGTFALIDSRGHSRSGDVSELDNVTRTVRTASDYEVLGYVASTSAGKTLLDVHGAVLLGPDSGAIACSWEKEGACSLRLPGGAAQLLSLPDGTRTDLPTGIDEALSRTFADSSQSDGDGRGTVYSLVSRKLIETTGRSSCTGAGPAFVVCTPDSEVLPAVVISAGGPTSFSSATPLIDPGPSGEVRYYQVTGANFTGIVDASGAWLYRQSSYLRLDD